MALLTTKEIKRGNGQSLEKNALKKKEGLNPTKRGPRRPKEELNPYPQLLIPSQKLPNLGTPKNPNF